MSLGGDSVKRFVCGDVVPGCEAVFASATDGEILVSVAQHAADAHGISPVPPDVLDQVRSHISPA
jgi:predicted small metal-binding protein